MGVVSDDPTLLREELERRVQTAPVQQFKTKLFFLLLFFSLFTFSAVPGTRVFSQQDLLSALQANLSPARDLVSYLGENMSRQQLLIVLLYYRHLMAVVSQRDLSPPGTV